MQIKSQMVANNKTYKITYNDGIPGAGIHHPQAVHAYCFYGDKFVVVKNRNGTWSPPGGSVEKGEVCEEAAIREVKEEANMKVMHLEHIGHQDIEVLEENRMILQCRVFCIVEPYGDFEADPDGDILEVKLIDPIEYNSYSDWGEIGKHIMARALEMKTAR